MEVIRLYETKVRLPGIDPTKLGGVIPVEEGRILRSVDGLVPVTNRTILIKIEVQKMGYNVEVMAIRSIDREIGPLGQIQYKATLEKVAVLSVLDEVFFDIKKVINMALRMAIKRKYGRKGRGVKE